MKVRLLILTAWLLPLPVMAADWPQFLGPRRDDISKETGLLQTWPEGGPKLLWTYANAGVGYSGPAVVNGTLYSMGARGDTEYVFALDLKHGQERWHTKIGPIFTWKDNEWNAGPSATPTVDGDLVFALGGQGDLVCVAADTGAEHWRKNLPRELGASVNPVGGAPENIGWGYTWSPLVDGDHLICMPGGPQGTLAALDKRTGAVVWRSKGYTDQASYSSPVLTTIGGVRQIVQLTNQGVTGVAAKDGSVLWRYQKEYSLVVIPTPVVHDNLVYITAATGGCDLVKITAAGKQFKATEVKPYPNRRVENRQGGIVLRDGYLYLCSGSSRTQWVCQDFKTGQVKWAEGRALKRGSLTYADGHLYCYGEDQGAVVLVKATPRQKWKEDGRFRIPRQSQRRKPSGKIWTIPVVAEGKLFLRDQDLIFCYDVKNNRKE